ncbi:Poly-beta-1,6-N-acetyl-D-glucosamine synthase [Dyella sp. AD56]|uniref:glycosyltransferase n=1 Tax=Dyella sp. AD56 TaxID=1528744 RepID=UPI000C84FB56|nr:glycosyltransferase [Dyella sp. AD56]PMQ04015.1 Poly-beta-1,6-N-acetyl-D-glucosamine synthase [Dyella sp. AD56]
MSVNAQDWSTRRRPFPITVRLPLAAANDISMHRPRYVPVVFKFMLAFAVSFGWATFAYVLSSHWTAGLESTGTRLLAQLLILGIAVLPAFMSVFLATGLLLDRRPVRSHFADGDFPAVSILIAAHNAQDTILDTLASIAAQRYPAPVEVMVINDGSTDATLDRLRSARYPWLEVLDLACAGGKSRALNAGLRLAAHPITVTLDADAHLHPQALRQLVTRYLSDPPNTAAVAGAVLVGNSRQNPMTRMQEWDYFQGISATRRVQSLCQGTLVAPATFSLYRTDILRVVGGWPECAGEDIVLTWAILRDHHRVGYAEDAIAFVRVPTSLASFFEQRRRWSRGVVEALKTYGSLLFRRKLSTFFIWWNLLLLYTDLIYTVALIPATVLACTGIYWLAGPVLVFAVPMALLGNLVIYAVQSRMFHTLGLNVRRNPLGLLGYALIYGLLLKPVSIAGYLSCLIPRHARHRV